MANSRFANGMLRILLSRMRILVYKMLSTEPLVFYVDQVFEIGSQVKYDMIQS